MATPEFSIISSTNSDIYLHVLEPGKKNETRNIQETSQRTEFRGTKRKLRGFVGGLPEIIERIALLVSDTGCVHSNCGISYTGLSTCDTDVNDTHN